MSLQPSALFGQPRASAMGWGMAITSGVFMNGVPVLAMAGCPLAASCWSSTAPHALEAGVQMTGAGLLPSVFHPSARAWAAAPDASEWGLTNTHLPLTWARVWLNDWASDVNRSIFSVDMVRSTTMQLPGSPTPLPEALDDDPDEHAAASTARAMTAARATSRTGRPGAIGAVRFIGAVRVTGPPRSTGSGAPGARRPGARCSRPGARGRRGCRQPAAGRRPASRRRPGRPLRRRTA